MDQGLISLKVVEGGQGPQPQPQVKSPWRDYPWPGTPLLRITNLGEGAVHVVPKGHWNGSMDYLPYCRHLE